jgi:hypothetical protein
VCLSELEGNWRVDAKYYQPHYLRYQALFAKHPRLEALSSAILHPVEVKRDYVDSGIQILLAQNIRQNYLDFSLSVYMQEDLVEVLAKNLLQPGDVVITRSGVNYGDSATYLGEPAPLYASADCLVIHPEGMDGAYLSTFFNTHYGRELLKRGGYGAAQPHIAPTYVGELRIPREETVEHEVVELVNQAHEIRRESKRLYHQAEQLLLDELGLSGQDLADRLCNEANISRVFGQARLDAEFFEPKYERLIQRIDATGHATIIGANAKWLRRGIQPAYVETGEIYIIKSKDIGEQFIDLEATERTDRSFWTISERAQVRQYDVLLNSTGRGTLGRANCYLETADAIADNHVTIIRPDESCDPVYLSLYLNSPIGRLQSERLCAGSSGQTELYPDAISLIRLFLPPNTLQLELRNIVLRAYAAEQRARDLLEQAKRKVEALIESEAAHG